MRYRIGTTDGSEFVATKLDRVENKAGKGYQIETEINGHKVVQFYKIEELPIIIPLEETKNE